MEKRKRWGASPDVRLMGQGDKAANACTCTATPAPLQCIFCLGRQSCPSGCGGHCSGRKRVCHAHVHHHWPARDPEVQEEVTALGIALGARREPCRTGGAAGVGGGRSTGGYGGIRRGVGLRGGAMVGDAMATACLTQQQRHRTHREQCCHDEIWIRSVHGDCVGFARRGCAWVRAVTACWLHDDFMTVC